MGVKEDQIKGLALFSGCRPSEIKWISNFADAVDLPAGTILAREGKTVREFVVLVAGVLSASCDDGEMVLTPGSYYGEMGLVDGRPYSMTIEASSHVRLLAFEARAFSSMIDRLPSVGRKLMSEMVSRLRVADEFDGRGLRAVS